MNYLKIHTKFFIPLMALAILVVSLIFIYFTNTSWTAGFRFYIIYTCLIVLLSLIFLERKLLKVKLVFGLLLFSLILISINLATFEYRKFRFFNDSLDTSNNLIAGFRNENELFKLVQKNKLAGVYFTQRNIRGKNKSEIKDFINKLQLERAKHSNKELLIMADNEGGIVSHLSPLLKQPEPLNEAFKNNRIDQVAMIHGKEMR